MTAANRGSRGGTDDTLPRAGAALSPTLPSDRGFAMALTLADDDVSQGDLIATLPTRDPARYRRGQEIARGGMGRIVAARDLELGRDIAIKELLIQSAELEIRFEREVRITAQLQHPSIIAVQEAGRWPDGMPFYVMQHVEGRGLDRAISASPAGERLLLLPQVIAVADAIAYAHSQRIIHRDLKPGNVLVGAFGETIVIDWGLAKRLGGKEAPARLSRVTGEAQSVSGALTTLGQALGTPCYMPPEQALGEELDERADVYALGAILYHVLSGSMPYADGGSVDAVLVAVTAGPPVALKQLASEVPDELAAIVEKAMSRDKSLRYADAAGFAGDVKRFAAGKLVSAHRYSSWQLVMRWVRRHRAAVAVGSAGVVALAVASVVAVQEVRRERDDAKAARDVANAARLDANAQRNEVEGLLDYMLVDLRDKLEGRLELLDGVAKRAHDYYAKVPLDRLAPADARRVGLALGNLSSVQADRGDLKSALSGARTSLALARRAAAGMPGQLSLQVELVEALSRYGGELVSQRDVTEALVIFEEALALARQLETIAPRDSAALVVVEMAHNNMADIRLTQRRLGDALVEHRAALVASRKLLAADPSSSSHAGGVSDTLFAIAGILRRQGDLTGALDAAREGLAIAEGIVKREPDDSTAQHGVAFGHHLLGEILLDRRDFTAALREYDASLAGFERLMALEPEDTDRQLHATVNRKKQGDVLFDLGRHDAALARYKSVLATVDKMLVVQPEHGTWQEMQFAVHQGIGDVRVAQRKHAEALVAYRRAVETAAAMVATHPDSTDWWVFLRDAHRDAGMALVALGRPAQARPDYQRALDLSEQLVGKVPEDPQHAKIAAELQQALR